jgi:hypothetical protein
MELIEDFELKLMNHFRDKVMKVYKITKEAN